MFVVGTHLDLRSKINLDHTLDALKSITEPFKKKFDVSFHFLNSFNAEHMQNFRTIVENKMFSSTIMGTMMTRHTHLFESFISEFAAGSSPDVQPVLSEKELRYMGIVHFWYFNLFFSIRVWT